MRPLLFAAAFAFALLSAVACGGDDEEADPCAPNGTRAGDGCTCNVGFFPQGLSCLPVQQHSDGGTGNDAGTDGGGQNVTCLVEPDLGTVTPTGIDVSGDEDGIFYYAYVNGDAAPDELSIQLYNGFGPFEGGIVNGVFELTGDEAQFATCAVCVLLFADVDPTGATDPAQTYLANGGTITLTSVEGRLTATLSNVTFQHVNIDEDTFESTPASSCQSTLPALSIDEEITVVMP